MTDPVFSILLPTHHRPDVIAYALNSILRQSESSFEVLVVGDGASRDTARVVESFSDNRIKWFDFPKSPGFGYANRNLALEVARGRYIAFMTDDDILFSDHLSILRHHLDNGAVLACTRAVWISSDAVAAPFPVSLGLHDEMRSFLQHANVAPSSCFGYLREAIQGRKHLREDVEVAADWHLWRQLISEHSPASLGIDSEYTVMHFVAKRKGRRDGGMSMLAALLEISDKSEWWPQMLRQPIANEESEQQFWAKKLLLDDG